MTVTGACVLDVVYLGTAEPDYDRDVTGDDLVEALERATREVAQGEFVESAPPRGNDAIGI
jgi:hypothetical protein